jgi:hypothetical protein
MNPSQSTNVKERDKTAHRRRSSRRATILPSNEARKVLDALGALAFGTTQKRVHDRRGMHERPRALHNAQRRLLCIALCRDAPQVLQKRASLRREHLSGAIRNVCATYARERSGPRIGFSDVARRKKRGRGAKRAMAFNDDR